MAQLKWGMAGGGILAAVMVGGQLYADEHLKAYYQQQLQTSPALKMQYQQFRMGAFQGGAHWTAEYIPDVCQPRNIVVFKGQDFIKRGWNGYQIRSEVEMIQAPKTLTGLIHEPFQVNSQVNWWGTLNATITTPKIIHAHAQFHSSLEAMTLNFRAKHVEQQLKILDFQLDVPSLTVVDSDLQLNISGLTFKTDQGLNGAYLDAGQSQIQLERLEISDRNLKHPFSAELQNLTLKTQNKLTDHFFDTAMLLHLDQFIISSHPSVQNVDLNVTIKNLHREKLQSLLALWSQNQQSCDDPERIENQIEPALMAVLNEGFGFESQHNQLTLGDAMAQANITGQVMPSHQFNLAGMLNMLPSLVQYKADIQFDKHMIVQAMKTSLPNMEKRSDQDVERLLSQMQGSGKIKREGDTMKMSVQYTYGDTQFLTHE